MTLLTVLANLYTTHHPMAPYSMYEHLYIKPSDPEGRMSDWPKIAQGELSRITFSLAKSEIAPPPKPDPYASEDEPNNEIPAPAPISADPVAAAVVALTASVEKLRASLKWGAGLIFVALLFLVGK